MAETRLRRRVNSGSFSAAIAASIAASYAASNSPSGRPAIARTSSTDGISPASTFAASPPGYDDGDGVGEAVAPRDATHAASVA